jgi:hypothetical protein
MELVRQPDGFLFARVVARVVYAPGTHLKVTNYEFHGCFQSAFVYVVGLCPKAYRS